MKSRILVSWMVQCRRYVRFRQNLYVEIAILINSYLFKGDIVLRFRRSRNYLASLGLRVGILFNVVAVPARKGDIDYISEAEVQDQVKAVQEAIMKLGLACHMFPVSNDVRTLVSSLELHKPDVV
ncbi:MAG: hypothetical protein QXX08_05205, partial [Candidatus Bathyarchaeia archaeon]